MHTCKHPVDGNHALGLRGVLPDSVLVHRFLGLRKERLCLNLRLVHSLVALKLAQVVCPQKKSTPSQAAATKTNNSDLRSNNTLAPITPFLSHWALV